MLADFVVSSPSYDILVLLVWFWFKACIKHMATLLFFTKMVAKLGAYLISCQIFAKIRKKHQKRPAKTAAGRRAKRGAPLFCWWGLCLSFFHFFAFSCFTKNAIFVKKDSLFLLSKGPLVTWGTLTWEVPDYAWFHAQHRRSSTPHSFLDMMLNYGILAWRRSSHI